MAYTGSPAARGSGVGSSCVTCAAVSTQVIKVFAESSVHLFITWYIILHI